MLGYRRSTPFYPMLLAGLAAYIGANPTAIPAVAGRNLYQGKMGATDEAIVQSLAAYAVVLAVAYCHRQGLEFQPADPGAPFLNNIFRFLHLGDDPAVIACIDHIWVQGCDHEMNNSAAALLHAASTLADPLSCVMSALTSSYGLRHFGAADSTYRMMERIGRPENVAAFLEAAKARGERIVGVGHRVYKGSRDPRTEPMKKLLRGLKVKGLEDPLVHIAYEIERQVEVDPYFVERRLQVNIDLYWPFGYTSL
jgi:citrate synthase